MDDLTLALFQLCRENFPDISSWVTKSAIGAEWDRTQPWIKVGYWLMAAC